MKETTAEEILQGYEGIETNQWQDDAEMPLRTLTEDEEA